MNRACALFLGLATLAFATPRIDTLLAGDGSKAGLWIPKSRKKLPLVVWLHGGIGANNPAKGVAAATNMASTWGDSGTFALVAPSAWPASPWWSSDAALRVTEFVNMASRRPGVDGTRIVLAGASDGGSGALWIAASLRTKFGKTLKGVAIWSAAPDVLVSQGVPWKPSEIKGVPLRWTAGGHDRLYPLERIHFWWEACQAAGIPLDPHENPTADHDLKFHGPDLAMFPAWVRKTAK
ncbi:MAG: hypothetical protein RL173_2684 [Fibrobacterota bacterium]|jgi:acetyl esterase/lipase